MGSNRLIVPESVWRHHSGTECQVIMQTNVASERQDEFPPTVVYRRLADNSVWSRPVRRWYGSFTFVSERLDI